MLALSSSHFGAKEFIQTSSAATLFRGRFCADDFVDAYCSLPKVASIKWWTTENASHGKPGS